LPGIRTEYEIATDSIKISLKRQGFTYKELARSLKLSESGIKKILSSSDGSFQRLAQICKEIGLSMNELLQGQDEGMMELSYTLPQQEYLVAHPKALRLYWALVYERRSTEEARKVSHLDAKELFSNLRKLDQLGLLELLPEGRLRLPAIRQIRWVGGGPLVKKLYEEWSTNFLKSVAVPERSKDQLFLIRYVRASRKTIEDLMTALHDLEAEFVRRGIHDMRSEAPDLEHLRWMSAVDNKSFLAD
jgi:transcriptional regulator with XRE-family HTH domain